MRFIETKISGLFIIEPRVIPDNRGLFVKVFNDSMFREAGCAFDLKESYYSISNKDVIRGMHFQTPPHDHVKVVYVSLGSVTDVVLDIRKNSPTFGKYFSMQLDDAERKMLYIPKGCAHGFKSLTDGTIMTYMQTTGYAPDNDCGISYSSFGFDWGTDSPVVSDRDRNFVALDSFKSPFDW